MLLLQILEQFFFEGEGVGDSWIFFGSAAWGVSGFFANFAVVFTDLFVDLCAKSGGFALGFAFFWDHCRGWLEGEGKIECWSGVKKQ